MDVERLYTAIVAELVVLWGEPSDAVSVQVRPIVARNIADRYARLSVADGLGPEERLRARIDALPRYVRRPHSDGGGMGQSPDGVWVYLDDVRAALPEHQEETGR